MNPLHTKSASKSSVRRRRKLHLPPGRWRLYVLVGLAGPMLLLSAVFGYYYVVFSRMIDARIHGQMQRVDPRVFARPFELRRGQAAGPPQLVERLNELGYAHRARAEQAGEFTVGRDTVVLIPREGDRKGRTIRVVFSSRGPKAAVPYWVSGIEQIGSKGGLDRLTLDAPLLTALVSTGREKRRDVPLSTIPQRMIQAVLAIEDHRFYDHPGIDPIGTLGAIWSNVFDDKPYLAGGSTLTQQIVKNTFLTPEKSLRRKTLEWFMSVILEQRLTKDQILELYLNDVALGQRGSFAIRGVAEAARLFFAKDITNVSLTESATIAGVIQSPSRLSPFNHPERARERRNVVLRAMAGAGFITGDAADRAVREPLQLAARALDSEAPHFVDYVSQELQEKHASVASAADVYTTLDLHLQRIAQDSVRDGLVRLDEILARRRRQRAQAALIAIDPRSGEILALVGGRSYNQSQFNRAVNARRQPGSVFKPFVYLAAFEHAQAVGQTDITAASLVTDEPTTFNFNEQVWNPGNYENEYDGPITLRRALALSRNIVAIKVAQAAGYDEVATLWRRVGAGTPPRPYPSIALGVFEATPLEIAAAYTVFPNGGTLRPLRGISRLVAGGRDVPVPVAAPRTVARKDTTFIVTNMMRSVINEGTGAGARANGFALDAAGKSGTTNDLRDAWFVGFTPELLTVVWVGLDDNQPLGLSGTQAALPIWTSFMTRALAGRPNVPFETPEGITFLEIDRDTGRIATPGCPRVFNEAFIQGTEPHEVCLLHSYGG
ncbi:MAG TPA: PBP1A family penicillin-binding protein [Vicinamibacterales bacterium]|nr:PBP1A family penicillin-binding protein [Vicinamibacterales bacterium]